jgi:hypothetical protein
MSSSQTSVEIYDEYLQKKASAIKAVYRKWGKILVNALRQATPGDNGKLRRAFDFRVEPVRTKVKIGDTIRLVVGILDRSSPVIKYFRYITRGTRSHFIPVKSNGRYTGILGWAQRHGLVTKRNKQWVWTNGKNAGKPFHGFYGGLQANDFFTRVYQTYDRQIQMEIRRILEGKNI